jgi:hypothetical protein
VNIKNRIERLEEEARAGGKELCQHLPPVIYWPDGRVENESTHACDAPRLTVTLGYSDASDERTRLAAVDALDRIGARFPEMPVEVVAEIVAREFQLTPEARHRLMASAGS